MGTEVQLDKMQSLELGGVRAEEGCACVRCPWATHPNVVKVVNLACL